jgi:hypothetical protein
MKWWNPAQENELALPSCNEPIPHPAIAQHPRACFQNQKMNRFEVTKSIMGVLFFMKTTLRFHVSDMLWERIKKLT